MTQEQFEEAVEAAIDSRPDEFFAEQRAGADDDNASFSEDELLGLYDGSPMTERDSCYGTGELPDVITIFKGPHERCFEGRERVHEEVRKTVIHEVGHYFGNDEAMLEEMGYR